MKSCVRIASGQGFWGDWPQAPIHQVRLGPIDYLVMDYLAEVTMSILQKQKLRNPALGYAHDFPELLEEILPDLVERGIKVITNAGGVNPLACRDRVLQIAHKRGLEVSVAVVLGDDILDRLDELITQGHELRNLDTGEPLSAIRDRVVSANVYFGAAPIVEALQQGAQIVITGRTTDTGLTLAPMVYEFGWSWQDYDRLASGVVAGHINECGAQATGGNFTDWQRVPDLAHVGFPIIEAYPDGSFVVTKHENTGGLVDTFTVREQLLYEIGDPRQYITPECVADFTSIRLEQVGENRVRVWGVRGGPPTEFYKVSIAYSAGWKATGTLVYAWPEAVAKAQAAAAILKRRLEDLGLHVEEFRAELIGVNACHEGIAAPVYDPNEVELRLSVRSHDYRAVEEFGRQIAPLILTGPSAVTGFSGGRPKPSEVIAYWPALLPKSVVQPRVVLERSPVSS
ncbi:MAG: DUF1446 domain-containing protein [Bacteroidetes bacterium]|nr:DUF1446 domain-containing protein [Rhodothermia bacterium]MCS7155624.1 DUF1446 domain-containing protein [Bacteroidota bacterium]MCX7906483.1 DUF1446 domain-containing protein [Bacteroidota bacterium]MDW8137236.1 acyclic terpene utilization AtuA family protein [Bacteroidota bacterium]MDW8284894.1 acyclic terpene utilization AtuA family protein [Bacteroidota bacterium]